MLTDAKIRAAKPQARPYRLADSGGLVLVVTPAGSRSWRWRYRVDGREQTLVIGLYPAIGLQAARRARDDARDRVKAGLPAAAAAATVPTFEAAAREWHATNAPRWKPHHAADVLASLTAELFPAIGALPVDSVPPREILQALRLVEQRGAIETARRLKQRASAVFAYAIAAEWATIDPTAGLKAALAPLPPKGRRAAVRTLEEARAVLAATDLATGQPTTRVALRVLALTAARPGEVAGMRWSELENLDGAEPTWRIPADRMKMGAEHIVPLAPATAAALEAIRPLTGRSRFTFPSMSNPRKPMSENTMGYLLARSGWDGRHVPHGWRATFSTVMNERFPADRQVIDLMLAHAPKDAVEAAYNRASHTARRREVATLWSDMLLADAAPISVLIEGARKS